LNSISPVLTESEIGSEQVIALGQEEYYPIIVARVAFQDGGVASFTRFRFTEKERQLILEGADLLLSQPHLSNLMPIGLQLAFPNKYAEVE
jgi:hypothetical protein